MIKPNILRDKSFAFAIRIVKLSQHIKFDHQEFVLSKQILRSGTAIGALIRESENASSKKDFIYKLNVALKEADETLYWLELLNRSGFLENKIFNSMENDCKELIKLLVSSLNTANK